VARDHFVDFDAARVPSPCFVVDEAALEDNLRLLQRVQTESGAKVLLALKAFSMFSLAPLVRRYLAGTCASGLFEARLGREEFGGEVHTFCAAYRDADFDAVVALSNHVVFNSMRQWQHFRARALAAQATRPGLRFGLRVNPRHSEGATPLYDPCAPASRLGIPVEDFAGADLTGISGLHFHTLCEQNLPQLAQVPAR
jgi:carboxynorspermidine decarboxylase